MEKIGFIGEFDKIDLIMYVAKTLTEMDKKVIILDTTSKQKTRYIVPAINPTISYITQFQNIDVAVGFRTFDEIKEYLAIDQEEFKYDYALIDASDIQGIVETGLTISEKIYYVTSFDMYSLKKGIEVLSELKDPLKLTKVYFSRTYYNEDDEYLEFLALGKKVIWNENIIYFPLENGDATAIAENQRLGKIKFKNLSPDYKEGIASIVSDIIDKKPKDIKNIIKNLE